MHELHSAQKILNIALDALKKEKGKCIKKIVIGINEKDHIATENFQKLLENLALGTKAEKALFIVEKNAKTFIKEMEVEK